MQIYVPWRKFFIYSDKALDALRWLVHSRNNREDYDPASDRTHSSLSSGGDNKTLGYWKANKNGLCLWIYFMISS